MMKNIVINFENIELKGIVSVAEETKGWVLFAHGSGSSRLSSRNNWVAHKFNLAGFSTLLFDLLTPEEDQEFLNRFNIPLLAERLNIAKQWLRFSSFYHGEPLAYFGASTGAAAALRAAADDNSAVFTVISRGGRPDLAGEECLKHLSIPVMLIVGGFDDEVIRLNEWAKEKLKYSELFVVKGATHLFEETGALDEVVRLGKKWLLRYLPPTFQQWTLEP